MKGDLEKRREQRAISVEGVMAGSSWGTVKRPRRRLYTQPQET